MFYSWRLPGIPQKCFSIPSSEALGMALPGTVHGRAAHVAASEKLSALRRARLRLRVMILERWQRRSDRMNPLERLERAAKGGSSFLFFPKQVYLWVLLLLWKECMLGPHDFTVTFVSGLVLLHEVRFGCFACMILHLSPTCLPLDSGCSAHMILHLSPTCLWLSPTCLPLDSGFFARMTLHLSPKQVYLWVLLLLWKECMLGPHDFTFVSGLFSGQRHPGFFPPCLHLSPSTMLWVLWSGWFRTCLPLISVVFHYTLDIVASARCLSFVCPWQSDLQPRDGLLLLHVSLADCRLRSPAVICKSLTLWFAVCLLLLYVALAAVVAFGRRFSFACPWHCDL